jgi:hypothetical protein
MFVGDVLDLSDRSLDAVFFDETDIDSSLRVFTYHIGFRSTINHSDIDREFLEKSVSLEISATL